MAKSCEGCRNYLGGAWGFCKLNLEDECAAGAFEAWEADGDERRAE